MKRLVMLSLIIALGLVGVSASARAAPGPGLLQRIAAIDGATTTFVQQDDILYAATGVKVSAYDVSDPAHPRHLADSPLMPEVVRDIAVSGDFLFAADDIGGLWAFRIQPDHQMQLARHLFANAIVSHVEAQGDQVYVTGWGQGQGFLSILETSGDAVRIMGRAQIYSGVSALAVTGDAVFITQDYELSAYDVADPAHIHLLDVYIKPSMDEFSGMQVGDGVAYILAQQIGGMESVLIMVDVSNPAALNELAIDDVDFMARALSLQQNTLYLAGSDIHSMDVSDPANPQVLGAYKAMATTLLASPTLLFSSNWFDDILISDIRDPAAPRLAGVIPKMGRIGKALPQGNRLYVSAGDRFRIFDISDPAHPRLLGEDRAGDGAGIEDFVVAEGVAYQAFRRFDSETMKTSCELRVLDIDDPSAPREIARYPLPLAPHLVDYANQRIYLAVDSHLLVFDVSEPAQPRLISFFMSLETINDLHVADDVMYTTSGFGDLIVWDVSDDYLPHPVSNLPMPANIAWELDNYRERVIVAGDYGGLVFVTVSQPESPKIEATLNCDAIAQNVAVAGDTLFAVCHDGRRQLSLHAYDLSDPEHPQARAATVLKRHQYPSYYNIPLDVLSAEDDLLFLNAGDGGLQIFRYLTPARARHLWLPSVHLPAASPFFSPAPTPTPSAQSARP